METVTARHIRQFTTPSERLGATYVPDEGTYVRLWAPNVKETTVQWGNEESVPLSRDEDGYFTGHFPAIKPGDGYVFHCDGKRMADPASRHQPNGVFGPSVVTASTYDWTDNDWKGISYDQWVIYEIHTGTFSATHDFAGIIADLGRLKSLGVTTLEIMPVSQFSGARNWGYDGAFPHAVQNTYGGPAGLKALVDACHANGLAIILDVVYNHVGPEGNVLFGCGPYTQSKYQTPWGDSLNFDGSGSDDVRRYFLQSAWQWLTEYHFDGLRLDAVQKIFDASPVPFLEDLSRLKAEAERLVCRPLILIAESDMNDSRLLQSVDKNGLGMDAQWSDDLHHCLHATLTGEHNGYYADYGGTAQLAKIYKTGVAYDGEYSKFRQHRHGRSYQGIDKRRLTVETQNHDQIGNRLRGRRLSTMLDFEKLKLAAACVMLSPFTPYVFMGEEFASETPFMYFVSHEDPKLLGAIRKGRQEEWKNFGGHEEEPDPGAPETFELCVLREKSPVKGSRAAIMQAYYKDLITLSKKLRGCALHVDSDDKSNRIILHYQSRTDSFLVILSFHDQPSEYTSSSRDTWQCLLQSSRDTADFAGIIAPFSATVFTKRSS